MSEPYTGEVRLFGGTFAPYGWLDCDGRLYNIADYDTLYALIGTAYGGDGETTFGVPDLRGRVPLHIGPRPGGSNYALGQIGGTEQITLQSPQMPAHTHLANAAATGQVASPANAIFATVQSDQQGVRIYSTNTTTTTQLNPASVSAAGGSQPHENMQPFLTIRYIICYLGYFPSRN